jgi:phosphoribosylanthranilate isomerase
MRHPWVKICGLTRAEDVDAAVAAGVDAVGLNLWPHSKRAVDLETARALAARLPEDVAAVLVFVDATFEEIVAAAETVGTRWVQLHGREAPELIDRLAEAGIEAFKALSLGGSESGGAMRYGGAYLLVDAGTKEMPGGTGRLADWALAHRLARSRPVILAGGLTPQNVAAAVRAVQPAGVDAASGVESKPGIKDAEKMRAFVAAAREAAAEAGEAGDAPG